METCKVNKKGEIVIPELLRKKYGFADGITVVLEEKANGILLLPMNEQYFEKYLGILKGSGNLKNEILEMKKEEKRLEERK